jgi:hypothetical protein
LRAVVAVELTLRHFPISLVAWPRSTVLLRISFSRSWRFSLAVFNLVFMEGIDYRRNGCGDSTIPELFPRLSRACWNPRPAHRPISASPSVTQMHNNPGTMTVLPSQVASVPGHTAVDQQRLFVPRRISVRTYQDRHAERLAWRRATASQTPKFMFPMDFVPQINAAGR